MGTLAAEPVFELLPAGLVLRGQDQVRAYYQHFFEDFQGRIAGFRLRSEWIMDEGVGQEYVIFVDGPGGRKRFDVLGILLFGDNGLLAGERLYASDELFQSMVGPVLQQAAPVSNS